MDLKTHYLGLELKHPVVASASPLSRDIDGVIRLAEAGASAIVLFSLFEEQIQFERESLEYLIGRSTDSFAESLSYFPMPNEYNLGPGDYLELIHRAAHAVDIPIIGSLNGVSEAGWTEYAKDIVEAGAKAIELNIFYVPADLDQTGHHVEDQYVDIVKAVKSVVNVPVAVKLAPFFSSMGNMGRRLVHAGADGLVLFNRFYQPDFDIDERVVESRLDLSSASEIRIALLWISLLHGRLHCSLAATSGVEGATEVVKYLLAGADAVMTTSALLRFGPKYLGSMVEGLEAWMEEQGYQSVTQMKGCMSHLKCAEPEALVRANYLKVLQSYKSTYVP